MALREILLELGIEVDDKGAEKKVDGLTTGLGKLKTAAIAAGAAFLTGKLAQGFASIITEAGDAAEVANKFGAVFVEEADRVGESLTDMAKRTGQSRIELQEMAADAGALVKPLVGSTAAAADLAQTMTEAAVDIASFENVLPKDALGALRSAVIGSSEPMLRFGVDTRQAALAQFALDKGLKKQVKDMSSAEVTALRMELIMKRLGAKGAVGDATKTAGSYTNRLRALQGAFKDLQIEIGKEFLPTATEALGVFIDLVRAIGPGLAKAARISIPVLRAIGSVVQGLVSPFERLDTALLAIGSVALPALVIAFKSVGVVATLTAIKAAAVWLLTFGAFLLIGAAILLVIDDLVQMGKGNESVIGTMITGINDLIDEWGGVGPAIGSMLDTALRFWLQWFGLTEKETDDWIDDLTKTLSTFWPNVIDSWMTGFKRFFTFVADGFASVAAGALDLIGANEAAERVRGGGSAKVAAGEFAGATDTLLGGVGTSPAATSGIAATLAPSGGGSTIINQPKTDIKVEVDATGQSNPAGIADMVSQKIDDNLARRDRQIMQSLTVGAAG